MAEEIKIQRPPHILLIPFPAQGHMLPILDFSHLLSLRNIFLTILTTPLNLPFLTPLLSKSPSIQTLSLPFPSHPSLPPGIENTKGLHPSFFITLIHVLAGLHDPLLSWIQSQIDHPINAIISDFFLGWTQPLAEKLGIPRIVFSPSGVLGTAVAHSLFLRKPKRPDNSDDEYPISFPDLPNCPSYQWRKLSKLYRTYKEGDLVSESVKQNFLWNLESHCFVSNSFIDLEGAYLGHPLKDLGSKRVYAVGPLAPTNHGTTERGGVGFVPFTEISAWLDSRHEGSVLYVSFGSQATLSETQSALLASALEKSNVSFIWAMAETTIIPEGFAERNKDEGIVVKGWAPQVAILRHQSVGWFLTHCGWNSVLEAIAAGVAMLTWPMTADQFVNARLLVEEAGVAVETVLAEEELGRMIEEMVIGERGEKVKKKAKGIKERAEEVVREGGSSFVELEGFVKELWKLNKN